MPTLDEKIIIIGKLLLLHKVSFYGMSVFTLMVCSATLIDVALSDLQTVTCSLSGDWGPLVWSIKASMYI